MLLSGIFIAKVKPRPSRLFLWNVFVGLILFFSTVTYTQLGCENTNSLEVNGTIYACNSNCVCNDISYTPVCDHSITTTYFSPCHAGCKTFDEKLNIYTECTCSDDPLGEMQIERIVTPGACASDCTADYYAYSFIALISSLVSITGLMTNVLLNFR